MRLKNTQRPNNEKNVGLRKPTDGSYISHAMTKNIAATIMQLPQFTIFCFISPVWADYARFGTLSPSYRDYGMCLERSTTSSNSLHTTLSLRQLTITLQHIVKFRIDLNRVRLMVGDAAFRIGDGAVGVVIAVT